MFSLLLKELIIIFLLIMLKIILNIFYMLLYMEYAYSILYRDVNFLNLKLVLLAFLCEVWIAGTHISGPTLTVVYKSPLLLHCSVVICAQQTNN